jgi:hypothetical protein
MLSLTQNLLLCVFCVQEKHVKFDTESLIVCVLCTGETC